MTIKGNGQWWREVRKKTTGTSASSRASGPLAGALLAADGPLAELNTRPAQHYGEALRVTLEQLGRHFPPGPPP
ncbi:hypothetical protein ACH4EC_15870 [Streptomyces anulatus]